MALLREVFLLLLLDFLAEAPAWNGFMMLVFFVVANHTKRNSKKLCLTMRKHQAENEKIKLADVGEIS